MPAKHPDEFRMLAVAMARMVGAEQTAVDLDIDVRTVRGWVAATPPRKGMTDEEELWAAVERNALVRNARALARGEIRDSLRVNNLAGTARDKLFRWASRREARSGDGTCDCILPPGWRADMHPKAGTPEHEQAVWQIALAKMPNARRVFMDAVRPLLAFYIDFHDDGGRWPDVPEARQLTNAALEGLPAPAADEDAMGVLIRWIEGLDDETLAARQTLADDALKAWRDAIIDELEERAYDAGAAEHAAEADARRATPPETPQEAPEPSAPAPTPIRRAATRSEPVPMVLDVGSPDHDRGWQPLERRDAPW